MPCCVFNASQSEYQENLKLLQIFFMFLVEEAYIGIACLPIQLCNEIRLNQIKLLQNFV